MATLERRSFAKGWQPDADAVNGPPDCLLRMDNLILDELGVVTIRPGSALINGVALADLDVHSLATFTLGTTRYRMAGANNGIYANGVSLVAGVAGTGDIAFGSHFGQIFMARSTTKKKYDGTTLRTWGIGMTGGTPTAAGIASDSKSFGTCAAAEVTWTVDTGGGTAAGLPGNALNHAGVAASAIAITPADTGRASITRQLAAPTDFSVLTAGAVATDDSVVSFYVNFADPGALVWIQLSIDVNDGTFVDDAYTAFFRASDPSGDGDFTVNFQPTPGWNRVNVRRGDMQRAGAFTSGKDWRTVKAVRVSAQMVGGGVANLVTVDNIQINGGAITGDDIQWAYIYVRNDGTATGYGKSGPSAFSALTVLRAQGATITVPADGGRDAQINEIWLFRRGAGLDTWYRVAVKVMAGAGAITIDDILSDADALVVNIKLELFNGPPPDNIIGIEGPYFDRTFVLTANKLYPSRRLSPDTFSTDQVITISGTDEIAYWVAKAFGGIYVGTSKDVYRLDGDGAELPDGTMNFTFAPTSIDHPPIGPAFAREGNLLAYLASDGWRVLAGGAQSASLSGVTSLLYKGKTRHGVSPVNLTTGRFKACVWRGQLVAITPEGASTTSSPVLYRHLFDTPFWYRHLYPLRAWRAVAREPDGTLIASDTAGFVWVLDTGTQDNAVDIAVTLWTTVDDDDRPHQRKDPGNLRVRADTGGVAMSVALHLDGAAAAASTKVLTQTGEGVGSYDLAALAPYTQLQLRVTGTGSTFRFYDYLVGYRERPIPMIGRVTEETGSTAEKVYTGLTVKLNTFGVARVLTVYLDNVALAQTFTITTDTAEPATVLCQFTATHTGTDIAFSVDGDIELFTWEPIVLYELPVRLRIWENKPLVPSRSRRRFAGLTLQLDTLGGFVTVTPVVDGFDRTPLSATRPDWMGASLTFQTLVGRDLWCRITAPSVFRVNAVEPMVIETLPPTMQGQVASTNAGYTGEKVLSGLKLRLCTLEVPIAVTPLLDGVAGTPVTFTTALYDPTTVVLQFTTPQTATDIAFLTNGEIELYEWEPIVLYQLPTRLKVYEHKPLVPAPTRRRFGGLTIQGWTHGGLVTLTPVVDGVDLTALTTTTTDLLGKTLTFPTVVGRDLWCRITGATPFSTHSVSPIITETLPQWFQGFTPRSPFGYPGVKTFSGLQLRVCTLGVAVTITPYLDGVAQTPITVTTGLDDPDDVTIPFDVALEGVELSLFFSGNVELYDWQPIVTAKRPLGILTWDSGPIDLGMGSRDIGGKELVWLREVFVKIRPTGTTLTLAPWFDGVPFAPVTVTVIPNRDTIVPIPVGRAYVGRQPRLVITSDAPFFPYWVKVVRRLSGLGTEKPVITIPVNVGGAVASP